MLLNKNILITGGTGSFGKHFTKFVLNKYKPRRLIIFSRDELKQFEMQNTFSVDKYNNIRYFVGDVRDRQRLSIAMKGVDYVIHAAAMKQVGASEYNPTECINTNIYGAENIIYSSIESNVKKVLALSTDKAVNPINLYGATKLASEKLFIAANNISKKNNTRFSIVRYGNVISSRGSVVEVFKNIVKNNNQFIPITDKDMTRFVITIDQGVKFVLNSLDLMKGGEVFIPKMPALKILDLANVIAPKIPKKIIGIKPGEKLHEVLFSKDESRNIIQYKNHYVIAPNIVEISKKQFFKYKSNLIGKNLKELYEYSSNLKNNFLEKKEIKKLLIIKN
tara:strand:- start:32567 stop:33571 length:1005 start_codon:yes stop_codon:yes gene_type:complete